MTDNPSIPDYPPTEVEEQWCEDVCHRIVKEAGPNGILDKELCDAFIAAYKAAVMRGEVWPVDLPTSDE